MANKAKVKELKVGEMIKIVKGGVLAYNTKSGVIINLPEKAAHAILKSPVLEPFVACPEEGGCTDETCSIEVCGDDTSGCPGEIYPCAYPD